MRRTLNFICPTDCLESVINKTFSGEHYFFTSLGNSLDFDEETVNKIVELISLQCIDEISFILSSENKIVFDALGCQDFSSLKGLKNFYGFLKREKKHSEYLWQISNHQFLISSYYLHAKTEQLKRVLEGLFYTRIQIGAKIYKKRDEFFHNIHSDPILKEKVNLN